MYLLLIARPISKLLFFKLSSIVKKLSDYGLSENEMFLFLESSDMGKKYTILYDKTKGNAYKIFWKGVSDNNLEEYVKYWSNKEFHGIKNRVFEKMKFYLNIMILKMLKLQYLTKKIFTLIYSMQLEMLN